MESKMIRDSVMTLTSNKRNTRGHCLAVFCTLRSWCPGVLVYSQVGRTCPRHGGWQGCRSRAHCRWICSLVVGWSGCRLRGKTDWKRETANVILFTHRHTQTHFTHKLHSNRFIMVLRGIVLETISQGLRVWAEVALLQ